MLEDNLIELVPWLVGIDNARIMVKKQPEIQKPPSKQKATFFHEPTNFSFSRAGSSQIDSRSYTTLKSPRSSQLKVKALQQKVILGLQEIALTYGTEKPFSAIANVSKSRHRRNLSAGTENGLDRAERNFFEERDEEAKKHQNDEITMKALEDAKKVQSDL